MSNLPPLPVLCDTPPPIDDFSNIPDDDYVDFDGIGDDYDVVIEEPPKLKSSFETREMEMTEDDTPLPYLGNRSPPDGMDEMTLDFSGDNAKNGRNLGGLDLDSPPSLNLSSGSGNDVKTSDDDFVTKQVTDDRSYNRCENVLESVDGSVTTSQETPVSHDMHHDRHIEGGSDGSDESDDLEGDSNKSQLNTECNVTQEAQQSLDLSFDDFADFQSVPPDKCAPLEPTWETTATTFDVDFSNFQADFSEIPPVVPEMELHPSTTDIDDTFDTFQEFCTADNPVELEVKDENTVINVPPTTTTTTTTTIDADDDDFGDFNDFQTTAPIAVVKEPELVAQEPLPALTRETFTEIINVMFPPATSQVEVDDDKKTFDVIPFEQNNITSKLKDIELSRALGYKYASSDSSKTLMESIGIDSKNVLFGMKWNPGMPRYAANLSFDPIQPQPLLLQPTPVGTQVAAASASKPNETSNVLTAGIKQSNVKEEVGPHVPAAQFDWSSAGLVNPLDVSQAHTLLLDEIDAVVMATRVTSTKFRSKPNSTTNSNQYLQNTISSSYSTKTALSPSSIASSKSASSSSLLLSSASATSTNHTNTKSINNTFYHTNNSHHRTFIGHHLDIGRYYDSPSQTPAAPPKSDSSPRAVPSNLGIDEEKVSALSTASSIMDEISTTGTTQYSDSSYSFKSDSSPEVAPTATHHQATPLSPTYGMSVRTITLPETHIFTPEKCTNAISQSVDRDAKVSAVKEYHDVEYKLDKSVTSDCISSITNSISENSVLNHFNSLSQPVLATSTSIDPIVESLGSKMSLKGDSGKGETLHNNANYLKKDNFPIFGTSPTDMGEKKSTDDDDFSDFQAAPVVKASHMEPIKPKAIQASSLMNPLPLSPVHLMKSAANNTLPEPDDDEMLRIEAFARSKSQAPSSKSNNNDDDEWSDFTSAIPQNPPKTTNHKTNTSHDDDWSDFVFTTPASMNHTIIPNHHRQTQKQQQAGNPSWNHQIFQQGNYMPWSTSTGQTPINYIQGHQFATSQQQQQPSMPELNFIQAQKSSFVNAPNRHQMMRK